MIRFVLLIASLFSIGGTLQGQEVFRMDFEEVYVPDGWMVSEKSEWGHELGEDGSSYFRFHPFSYRDFLQSPEIELEEGYYVLYFSWNEAHYGNPDFCNVRIREGDEVWDRLYTFGSGNNRTWERDSAIIGNLDASAYTIEFEYKSLPRYPAQYLNIDNVSLVRSDRIVSGTVELLRDLKIRIMPNPVQDILRYSLNDQQNRLFDLRVTDVSGRALILEKGIEGNGTGSIDVSELPPGIYCLEFRNMDGVRTERFVLH